ncbi:MAG: hypothetical protein K6C30_03015 [Bacteroidaceae bacterium]|nr:hypothetical protein [Bacteroidaceae bacterium]
MSTSLAVPRPSSILDHTNVRPRLSREVAIIRKNKDNWKCSSRKDSTSDRNKCEMQGHFFPPAA